MRRLLALTLAAGALLFTACQDSPEPLGSDPMLGPSFHQAAASAVVPGHFIVTLRPAADPADVAAAHGLTPDRVYRHALNGFAGPISEAARQGLLRDFRVTRVEPDMVVSIVGDEPPLVVQENATWGLDRVDQRDLPLNQEYHYTYTGAGVNVYILDTGIRYDHADFGGRAFPGFDAFDDGRDGADCNGHGTHVAGTAGGGIYGIAKQATLYAVRVLNCNGSGTVSGVIAGVDWVTGSHSKPAVANMSLSGGANSSLDDAVRNSIAAGVLYAVSAGNGNMGGRQQPACNYSPARVRQAMTVGATNTTDTKASWSNYGECVDLFAPGVSITSAWHTSPTATNTISGTSMSAPHVAGVAALYLQADPYASAVAVFSAVFDATTKNIVKNSSTANNHLLYSLGFGDGAPEPPPAENQPPTAAFSFDCAGLTCTFTDQSTDSDGSVVAWQWSFGDGNGSAAQHPTHTFATGGQYTVALTVTDNEGATASTSQLVQVSETLVEPGDFTLSVFAYKVRGRKHADLVWAGATSVDVAVYRDGSLVATVPNSGSYTHVTNEVGGGSHAYRVCEAGTNTCSNEVVVSY